MGDIHLGAGDTGGKYVRVKPYDELAGKPGGDTIISLNSSILLKAEGDKINAHGGSMLQ